MPGGHKIILIILVIYLWPEHEFEKQVNRECDMLIRIQSTPLLQILWEIMLNSEVNFKSIRSPDATNVKEISMLDVCNR